MTDKEFIAWIALIIASMFIICCAICNLPAVS